MARIDYARREDLSGEMQQLFDRFSTYGPFASLVGAMANRPPILKHVFGMLLELREEDVLPRRYLEIALVVVSQLNDCDYCVAHHAPMLSVQGISAEGVANLLQTDDHPELDETDKLVVAYAKAVTEDHNRVRDDILHRLGRQFSNEQIVELTWRIALCGAFNRFNDVLQLEIEDDAEQRLAGAQAAV